MFYYSKSADIYLTMKQVNMIHNMKFNKANLSTGDPNLF